MSLPIGQVDAVIALQVLDAYNTVANGGVYVSPKLVQATVSPSGTLTKTAPSATHTAISPSVDSELTSMLEQVVKHRHRHQRRRPRLHRGRQDGDGPDPHPGSRLVRDRRLHGVVRRVRGRPSTRPFP